MALSKRTLATIKYNEWLAKQYHINNPVTECKLCKVKSINGKPILKRFTFKSIELSPQYCAEPQDGLCMSCWNKLKPLDKIFFNYHKNITLIKTIDRIPKNG